LKTLFLIFIASTCFAARGNFLAGDIINSGDSTGQPVFRLQEKCEAHYKKACFDITSKDIKYNKVKQVDVDDTSKPIYEAKSNVQACEGQADCFEKKDKEYCSDIENVEGETVNVCTSYCGQFGSGLIAFIDENYSEVYCTKIIGYKQKKIDKLVEDKELRAKFEKEKSDKEAEKLLKKSKKEAAKEWVKNCNEEICLKLKDLLEL